MGALCRSNRANQVASDANIALSFFWKFAMMRRLRFFYIQYSSVYLFPLRLTELLYSTLIVFLQRQLPNNNRSTDKESLLSVVFWMLHICRPSQDEVPGLVWFIRICWNSNFKYSWPNSNQIQKHPEMHLLECWCGVWRNPTAQKVTWWPNSNSLNTRIYTILRMRLLRISLTFTLECRLTTARVQEITTTGLCGNFAFLFTLPASSWIKCIQFWVSKGNIFR